MPSSWPILNLFPLVNQLRENELIPIRAHVLNASIVSIPGTSFWLPSFYDESVLFVLTENDAYLEKEGDVKGIASSCNELALFFMEQNNFEKTITYVDRTADLSKKLGSRELLAMAPMKLALGRW